MRFVKRAERKAIQRAMTNATTTATGNFTSFANGTQASPVMLTTAWAPPAFLALAERMIVKQGYTEGRGASIAEYANAAQLNENAAVTPTALGTITTASSTLIESAIGTAITSQALNYLEDQAGFQLTMHDLAIHAIMQKAAADLWALVTGAGTTNTDRAGLKAIWATVTTGVQTIRATAGARVKVVLLCPEKVKNELLADLRTQAASYLSGPAAQEYVAKWPTGAQLDIDSLSFVYDDVAVYVTNLSSEVTTADVGSNYLNILFVPSMPAQEGNGGSNEVMPAFALFGRETPSFRRDAESVADIDGIGVMRYPVPVAENGEEYCYVADFDAILLDANKVFAFKSGVTA